MCTLTYLPTKDGFIFTHNRDERMNRPTSKDFRKKVLDDQELYYPEDLEAHGSWIAFSNKGTAACLLNGGSEAHQRKPSYRKSRGLVVLESFDYASIPEFYANYDFEDIEPFTLLIHKGEELYKLVHNEHDTQLEAQDPGRTNIWSSTTLYTREVRDKRRLWFENWLESDPQLTPNNIRQFHGSAGDGDSENDLVMSRWGILKTLSITQLSIKGMEADLVYEDFVLSSNDSLHLNLKS